MNSIEDIQRFGQFVEQEVGRVVYGHNESARLLLSSFLLGGHILIEGAPGIGKTLMAKTFAHAVGRKLTRVQFTPDLMPSDITGVSIFDRQTSTFRFAPGPLFCDILLADEINRTPPKTQSSLLEAMEERTVTVDGMSYPLTPLFFVVATQNPIEQEGTYPLPEAQLDRFLFKLTMSYPDRGAEENMIRSYSSADILARPQSAPSEANTRESESVLLQAQTVIRRVEITPALASYIMSLVVATRERPEIALGASPRAALHLTLAAKANAAFSGRNYVIPDDVKATAQAVLGHRLILSADSYGVVSVAEIIQNIIDNTPMPNKVTN